MIKQTFERLLGSRTGQMYWSGVFCLINVGLALINTSPLWSALSWACAGFLLCNTLHAAFRAWYVRVDRAVVERNRVASERAITTMAEHVKAEIEQYAAERGYDIDIEIGQGEPPPRWRQ